VFCYLIFLSQAFSALVIIVVSLTCTCVQNAAGEQLLEGFVPFFLAFTLPQISMQYYFKIEKSKFILVNGYVFCTL
jgi:hypothetical protein